MSPKTLKLQQHQTDILLVIHHILVQMAGVNAEDFRKNELLKDRIASQLQEISQATFKILHLNQDNSVEYDKSIYEKLSTLYEARYHEATEHSLVEGIWYVVKNDIPKFERLLKEDMISHL